MYKNPIQVRTENLLQLLPKNLLSIPVYLATFPITVIVTIFIIPLEIIRPVHYLFWLLIGLAGHLAMLPFVIYGNGKRLLKDQVPLLLAMGAVRGGTIGLLIPLFGLEDQVKIPVRAFNSMLFVFYLFQVSAILYEFRYVFRKQLTQLLSKMIANEKYLNMDSPQVRDDELVIKIGHLQEQIRQTIARSRSKEDLQRSTQYIDNLVRDHIRPLSKSKWEAGNVVWNKLGFFYVLMKTLNYSPLPVFEVYILTLPLAVTNQILSYGFVVTFTTQCIWLVGIIFLVNLIKIIFQAKNKNYLKQNLAIIFTASFFVAPLIYYVNGFWPGELINSQRTVLSEIYTSLLVGVLFFASSLLSVLSQDMTRAVDFLEKFLGEQELDAIKKFHLESERDLKYSQYLHNEVQSQLLACKLLLLKTAESDFKLLSPDITSQITERLERIKQPLLIRSNLKASELVKKLANSWHGLAEITYELPAEFDAALKKPEILHPLLEESVINAIRHGHASKIDIKVDFSPSGLNCLISNNGIFPENKNTDGLGSILFNTFTSGWTIERDGEVTTLSFSLEMDS